MYKLKCFQQFLFWGNYASYFTFVEQDPAIKLYQDSVTIDSLISNLRAQFNKFTDKRANADVRVNVLVCKITDKKGKTTQFSWITDIALNHKNLKEIMNVGRNRWKIEHETFNTLKTNDITLSTTMDMVKISHLTVLDYLMLLAFHDDQLIQRGVKKHLSKFDK